jgi:hypothetical protein
MLAPEISEFLEDFRPKTHAVVFYDAPEKKHDLLFSHLKFGAEKNEGLAYVYSEENSFQIQDGMKKSGIDVDGLKAKNRLALNNYNRVYIVDGKVDIPDVMNKFADLSNKYISMGLDGMRASAEMSCFFNEDKVKELIQYEYALHRILSFPAEGICAYNIFDLNKSGSLGMIMPLVRAHDPVILAGPKESLLLEPEKVEDKDIEETMKIKIA